MKIIFSVSFVLLLIGLAFVACSYNGLLLPQEEAIGKWFQRSGTVLTVTALVSDFLLALNLHTVFPGKNTVTAGGQGYEAYQPIFVVLGAASLILTVAGAVISGFGDLFL
ncbi:hypothetical protein [Alloalcanivorax venustensis]|uniref:hypothetical protein n=1 Tax=Alloalcanivorax venustensis TaxID=172371 RepID=UPI003514B876